MTRNATIVTPTLGTRLHALIPALTIGAIVTVLCAIFILVTTQPVSEAPLSINNPRPNGMQALARVLEQQGFTVEESYDGSEAITLMKQHQDSDPTLVIMDGRALSVEADTAFSSLDRVIVVETPLRSLQVSPDVENAFHENVTPDAPERLRVESGDTASQTATIAQSVSYHGDSITSSDPQWNLAFPIDAYGLEQGYLYGEKVTHNSYRAVFASQALFTNAEIKNFGNAALTINALTAHSSIPPHQRGPIIIYHASLLDTIVSSAIPTPQFLYPSALIAFLAFSVWGLSQGMRLGRLVPEDLPSYVPAAETITGQGRLLYRNKQREHAAQLLRIDTASRLTKRLGLPSAIEPEALKDALIRAGATPEQTQWLWTPVPAVDEDLIILSHHLNALEKEIRQ